MDAFANAVSGTGRVHFLGLVSDGGVHSHIDHLFALVAAAKEAGVPSTFVHCFAGAFELWTRVGCRGRSPVFPHSLVAFL